MTDAPLAGVTILDLSRVLSGPYCTMLAADMGARVIKIEHPVRGDDTRAWGPPFVGRRERVLPERQSQQGKRRARFQDSRTAARILDALIARADVLVENFRPGTLDALGLGYASSRARHPRLIYVSISGFGQTGPRRDEAGYDAVAQAEGGLMSITGTPDGPPVRLGVAIADLAAGMFAFQGMLLALIARGTHRTRPARGRQPARLRRRAAHLSGQPRTSRPARRRRAPAIATRRSRRTTRSTPPTACWCWPSATTISGSASVAPSASRRSAGRCALPTNARRVRTTQTLRPLIASAHRARGRSPRSLVERCAPPACRAAPCARSPRRSPIRRSSRAR